MGLYVLAKDMSLVSVNFLMVICMSFDIEDWVWPQHPQLLPRVAIRLEYVVPRWVGSRMVSCRLGPRETGWKPERQPKSVQESGL